MDVRVELLKLCFISDNNNNNNGDKLEQKEMKSNKENKNVTGSIYQRRMFVWGRGKWNSF